MFPMTNRYATAGQLFQRSAQQLFQQSAGQSWVVLRQSYSGYTLIEVIVVFTLIAILSSVVMLSVSLDQSTKVLKQEAVKLQQLIRLAEEEAIFQSKEMGIEFTSNSYRLLVWEPKLRASATTAEQEATSFAGQQTLSDGQNSTFSDGQNSRLSEEKENMPQGLWVELSDRHFQYHELPEKMSIHLIIENAPLEFQKKTQKQKEKAVAGGETQAEKEKKSEENKYTPQLLMLSSGEVTAAEIEIRHSDQIDAVYRLKLDVLGQLTMEEPNEEGRTQ